MGVEIHSYASVSVTHTPKKSFDASDSVKILPRIVGPYITSGIGIFLRFQRLLKPFMIPGSVSGHQIQHHMYIAAVRLFKQTFQVRVGSVPGSHLSVIGDIVSRIQKRRLKAGIQPQGIASKLLDIVQMIDNSLDITDAVCVCIRKGLGINLIKYCVFQPFNQLCLPPNSSSNINDRSHFRCPDQRNALCPYSPQSDRAPSRAVFR